MVEIDVFTQHAIIAFVSVFATAAGAAVLHRMSGFRSAVRRIPVLENNLKVLVLVLSDELNGFRERWDGYARVHGVELIEDIRTNGQRQKPP